METSAILSLKQSSSSNEEAELKRMKSTKSYNDDPLMNDSLPNNILQDIKQLQNKVKSIENDMFKKKKPDFRKEIKIEILNILKAEPELMGWNSANTKQLEDRILKLENELQDMMTLVLELCDSFPKGDSELVSQCESKQLHKLVKLELDTLTREVLDSNKRTLKSFNKDEIRQLRADLKAGQKRNSAMESRLETLENANRSKQSISNSKENETKSNNTNAKSGSSNDLKTKVAKFQTENKTLVKKDEKIPHDEKKSSSTKVSVSTVAITKRKAKKSSKKDVIKTEKKREELSKNKLNELKKVLPESG